MIFIYRYYTYVYFIVFLMLEPVEIWLNSKREFWTPKYFSKSTIWCVTILMQSYVTMWLCDNMTMFKCMQFYPCKLNTNHIPGCSLLIQQTCHKQCRSNDKISPPRPSCLSNFLSLLLIDFSNFVIALLNRQFWTKFHQPDLTRQIMTDLVGLHLLSKIYLLALEYWFYFLIIWQ